MKLNQFMELLEVHGQLPFHLVLPGSMRVPESFHITEVAYVTKKFIDCGGKVHVLRTCQLQAWVWTDTEHRLLAGKMAGVLNLAKAKGVLPSNEDPDVEIEYEAATISQYMITDYAVVDGAVILNLASKHTDCLAKAQCLPSLPMAVGNCGPACNC